MLAPFQDWPQPRQKRLCEGMIRVIIIDRVLLDEKLKMLS